MPVKFMLAALGAVGALAVSAGPAAADSPWSMTLHYTGAAQSVTVPAGAVGVQLSLTGGSGGRQGDSAGGHGAAVLGRVPVHEGDELTVDVAGAGADSDQSGPGRGGFGYTTGGTGSTVVNSDGSDQTWNSFGAGGGGSSAVLDGATVLAVAGGGGGSGAAGNLSLSRGADGGDAGATPAAGKSSNTAKGGLGGVTAGGVGANGAACGSNDGAGGGGGGGGALAPGGGAGGGCGAGNWRTTYAGAGGGSGASAAPAGGSAAPVASTGNGWVTLHWVWPPACQDATVLVDSKAPQGIDLSPLCTGKSQITGYSLLDESGVGRVSGLNASTGRGSVTVAPGETGVGVATVKFTNAIGTATARVTLVVAPAGRAVLRSGALALDGGSQEIGNPVVAEPATGSSQQWTIHPDGDDDGAFVLADARDDACLATSGLGRAAGTPFVLSTCGYDVPSRFRITADGDGVRLTELDSGLPVGFTSTDPGALLALGNTADTPTWQIGPAAAPSN